MNTTCPPKPFVSACNCSFPFFGFNCSQIRCDLLSSCSQCNSFPQCQFCCNGTNAGGVCSPKGTCTGNVFPASCPSCPQCNNGGFCSCGTCVCVGQFGGPNCNFTKDCTGNFTNGRTPKVIDACGICGGNGTSCIGCDGVSDMKPQSADLCLDTLWTCLRQMWCVRRKWFILLQPMRWPPILPRLH